MPSHIPTLSGLLGLIGFTVDRAKLEGSPSVVKSHICFFPLFKQVYGPATINRSARPTSMMKKGDKA
jgi:hypothetical protein